MSGRQTRKHFYLLALAYWLILAVLSILVAIFREAVFIPLTGLDGTLARALLLPVSFGYTAWLAAMLIGKAGPAIHRKDCMLAGLLWLVMTVAFEFSFGTLVMGNTIDALLADYNIFRGRTWPLFLLWIAAAPYAVFRIRSKKIHSGE